MLPFKKHAFPRTIVIDRLSAVTAGQLLVRDTWQPEWETPSLRHTIHNSVTASSDPLDDALRNYTQLGHTKKPLHSLDFSPASATSGNIWHHGTDFMIAVKGMPERIIDHCDVTENEREALLIKFHALSATGNYVIAFAEGRLSRDITQLDDLQPGETLTFAGFVCLRVDVTATSRQLVHRAQKQGSHIVLITGQHPHMGLHIGRQLGLARASRDVYDARQLAHLSDSALQDVIRDHHIITRADGDQKRHLVSVIRQLDDSAKHVSTASEFEQLVSS